MEQEWADYDRHTEAQAGVEKYIWSHAEGWMNVREQKVTFMHTSNLTASHKNQISDELNNTYHDTG